MTAFGHIFCLGEKQKLMVIQQRVCCWTTSRSQKSLSLNSAHTCVISRNIVMRKTTVMFQQNGRYWIEHDQLNQHFDQGISCFFASCIWGRFEKEVTLELPSLYLRPLQSLVVVQIAKSITWTERVGTSFSFSPNQHILWKRLPQ